MKCFNDWPLATKLPRSPGRIKQHTEDFCVREEIKFHASGEGEHLLLQVRKVDLTTAEAQKRIAKAFGVPVRQVGYAGIKDKSSVAIQHFSVQLPNAPDSTIVPRIDILERHRHVRKLRQNDVLCNTFDIVVREVIPELVSFDELDVVPNYFGEQRFGRNGDNVRAALKWVDQSKPRIARFLRSMYISSMRSYVFNQVLAARVAKQNWREVIDGDIEANAGIPTGPLWGRGHSPTTGLAGSIESAALVENSEILDALEWIGLGQERRDLVLAAENLKYEIDGTTAHLHFSLNTGCFATSVLRECFDYETGAS